ncbi:MAG: 4Fe-4S binding protein [Deltaproteobacteria bacterium]|nr:4Fe-4S binding protein [Deltaproteobacteria bacterium]MBW1816064.1 4Fe-4S binding protein [Deltaproteobacteria bacterium]MBW2284070.1 4Fe-4S binding protein [Deltaproteobacteria bacterium]
MTFEEIYAKAVAEWEPIEQDGIPVIRIGTGTSDRASGALDVLAEFEKELGRLSVEARIIKTGSIGFCNYEPLVVISRPDYPRICYNNVKPDMVSRLVEGYLIEEDPCMEFAIGTLEGGDDDIPPHIPELPRAEHEMRLLLRNCGFIDPENIQHYIALGGYRALAKALEMDPVEIIEEIKRSGLRGRGGAGFPTGRKIESCFKAAETPKYVICNADEGDPGAFMDRVVLESDPHAVLEGMIISAFTVGSPQGYIYTRMEYPLAVERLKTAIGQARELGLMGENILGSGFSFDIEVFQGAGAFICGESSALMYSLEGKRGFPRVRPPQSIESGLWQKPTQLNNVKTFSYFPVILDRGSDFFSGIGSEKSKGTAVFALAGRVENVGLVEVPMGTTLDTVVNEIGGGVTGGKRFKGVQIGGPSGGCLPESFLGTPIDFDSLTEAGAMMGSGGMIVMDEDNCMVDAARFFLDFTVKESCGKCAMCRLGTKQMLSILDDIVKGEGKPEDIDLLTSLGRDIIEGSLCGLGKSAPNPVLTTIKYFKEEYESHIHDKRCPALVCRDLITYYIIPEKCYRGCEHCMVVCPAESIVEHPKRYKVVDQEKCVKCGNCLEVCPPEYDAIIKVSPAGELPNQDGQ